MNFYKIEIVFSVTNVGLVCSFIFVMFIVLLTAIFAALAWDSESNNKESRWILVSAIATAGDCLSLLELCFIQLRDIASNSVVIGIWSTI